MLSYRHDGAFKIGVVLGMDVIEIDQSRRCRCVKACGANGDDFGRVQALHRCNGIAGVDGALKGVGGIDLGDVRYLSDVKRGGRARGDVMPDAVAGNKMCE